MSEISVAFHPVGTAPEYTFSVVLTVDGSRVLLGRHRDRDTWETQGGHVEDGESIDDAARRELYEESGVIPATLTPICDYISSDATRRSWGRCYVATVARQDELPESEIAEVAWFEELPHGLTHPWILPLLYADTHRRQLLG